MKKILIIMGRYIPGYKDGGPVRTIKNLVDCLGSEYAFNILTCDRDHGDIKPYDGIKLGEWNQIGKAKVYYVSPGGFKFSIIKQLANQADLVYLCGCFSDYSINTLILKRLDLIKKPVIVAAMGLFMPNAMKKKPFKYKAFLKLCYILGMFNKLVWSATSEYEATCIQKFVNCNAKCYIAQDLPRLVELNNVNKEKKSGELKVFFLSRISPEKNLLGTIRVLKKCQGNIIFTIYGPIYDNDYWNSCLSELKKLPQNVIWDYKGVVDSESVVETMRQHQIFLFMTNGENYGHVIQEALSAGCPCVISDQTPWNDLDKEGVGNVIPLQDDSLFIERINQYIKMRNKEFQDISDKAVKYAVRNSNEIIQNTGYRRCFDELCKGDKD